jgi:hypothetical protein
MKTWMTCALLAAAAAAHAEPRRAVFEKAGGEQSWPLKEWNAQLPADWSGYRFLVLELKLSSPQRFDLRIHNAGSVRSVRLAPVPGVWIRGVVPLEFLTEAPKQGMDLASVHNKHRAMMFLNLSGAPGPLDAVREIGVSMTNPTGAPVLEIRSATLAKEDPGDALLEKGALVDELGQWIHDDWSGKAKSLEQLKADWAAEEKALGKSAVEACGFGGYLGTSAKATGFFRVEKIDGRWWFVDPDGHLFWSAGIDSMGANATTPVAGREQLFAAMPPRPGAFYAWNVERRFGADWTAKWIDLTLGRMAAWGFNTIGNWSDVRLGASGRMPYVVTTRGWGIETGPMGVADVYAPDFEQRVEQAAARQCDGHKDDPYLLGYFLGNEPPWPGRESVAADAILAGPATPLQTALKSWLAEGDTADRRRAFLFATYEKFVTAVTAAVKKHDPKHLSLGIRFGSSAPEDIVKASKIFDVYSLNNYNYAVNRREIEKVRGLIDRPILIGEFHFGTPGRGMTPGLRQVADQQERGVAYRYYVENAASDPSIVGTHWFEWIDEPATGRFDGENYNIGLVDTTDRPYAELTRAAAETHRRIPAVHAGREKPVDRQAKVQ